MNYILNKRHSILLILLKDDPRLYVWDLQRFVHLPSIKLYEPTQLPQGMTLLNSQLTTHGDHCVVLLQFQNAKPGKRRIASVLYAVQLQTRYQAKSARVVLYDKLGSVLSPVNGHDLFMSQVMLAFEDVPDGDLNLGRRSNGYLLIVGTTTGYTLVAQVDLLAHKVHAWAYYKKLEGSIISPGDEEISAMMMFHKSGTIAAMASGRIVFMLLS